MSDLTAEEMELRVRSIRDRRRGKATYYRTPRPGPIVRELRAAIMAASGADPLSPSTAPEVVEARGELCARLRALGWSYPRIAPAVGYRDHTSVIYAVRRYEASLRARERDQSPS